MYECFDIKYEIKIKMIELKNVKLMILICLKDYEYENKNFISLVLYLTLKISLYIKGKSCELTSKVGKINLCKPNLIPNRFGFSLKIPFQAISN